MRAICKQKYVKGLTAPLELIDLSNTNCAQTDNDRQSTTFPFEIDLADKTLSMAIIVRNSRANLSDLTTITHQVCNKVIETLTNNDDPNFQNISCKKGCSHCCKYMVSLSSAEAFFLHNHILSMPADTRRSTLHSFLRAARIISANRIPNMDASQMTEYEELHAISNWFNKLNLTCPFLKNNACSIYNFRPLACREHLATNDPKGCKFSSIEKQQLVNIPFSIAQAMMTLCNKIENTLDEAVILPLVMVWCNVNQNRMNKKYPAILLAEEFINAINEMVPHLSSQAAE